MHLQQPREGQAVRLPGARRGAHLPLPRRAHRRAGAGRAQEARCRCAARCPRRAGGGARRHLHGSRQDRRRVRRHRGLTVDAFKATGVSLRRDILAMEDAGARRCAIFTDLGVVTTTRANGPALTRTMLTELAAGKPDVLVFELGDGILGTYRCDAILECPDIRAALTAVILSANDPVAAWGGVKLLRERFHIEPCVVTGPSTDNQVGVEIITSQMGVPAFNAISNGAALGDCVIEALGLKAAVLQ